MIDFIRSCQLPVFSTHARTESSCCFFFGWGSSSNQTITSIFPALVTIHFLPAQFKLFSNTVRWQTSLKSQIILRRRGKFIELEVTVGVR